MNYILLRDSDEINIKKSLKDMANMYANTEFVSPIHLYRVKSEINSYLVKFPNPPDFERFCYFVNYLKFPVAIPDYNPTVYGVWEISKKIKNLDFIVGETIGLYISEIEDEYDNVYAISSAGKMHKITFHNKVFEIMEIEVKYEEIVKPIGDIVLAKEIYPAENSLSRIEKPWWKFW